MMRQLFHAAVVIAFAALIFAVVQWGLGTLYLTLATMKVHP